MEKYKDIPSYEGKYKINTKGNVLSVKNNTVLKQINTGKYYAVNLYNDSGAKLKRTHQLMAMTFLNHVPNGLTTVVDHIDNNPLNNNLENLQIVTNRYNSSKDKKHLLGVRWSKQNNKWQTRIRIGKNRCHLGYFKIEEEAHETYLKALSIIHLYENNKQFRLILRKI